MCLPSKENKKGRNERRKEGRERGRKEAEEGRQRRRKGGRKFLSTCSSRVDVEIEK